MTETTFETDHAKFVDIQVTDGAIDTINKVIDGKGTQVINTWDYPMKLMGGFCVLKEAPDDTSTLTVQLTDGTSALAETLTFTYGTEAAGSMFAFLPSATTSLIQTGYPLTVVTAGTTATNGEVTMIIHVERQI